MSQLNTWELLNFWEEVGPAPEPGDCIPWIGSGWVVDCPEQHYTLSWICCDGQPAPVEEDGGPHVAFHTPDSYYLGLARHEDEEILLIARAFVEIITCR